MKKITYCLFGLAFLLASCGDVINKKPTVKSAKEDIEKIREKHPEYTDEDYSVLGDELIGGVMANAITGDKASDVKFDKTYKEYLEEARTEREEKERVKKELSTTADVELVDFTRIQGQGMLADYDVNLSVTVDIKNNSNKDIQAISGSFQVIDIFGKKIESLDFEYTEKISAKAQIQKEFSYDISIGSDLKELDKSSFDKLRFNWVPKKIIFTDGTAIPN